MRYIRIAVVLGLILVMHFEYYSYNPMIDFQVPYSVSEQIHEALFSLERMLHDTTIKNTDRVLLVNHRLQDLEQMSQKISDTHTFHAIYRDDRQTLQTLIDRIDALLAILQNDENALDDQAQKSVQESRTLLTGLKSKF